MRGGAVVEDAAVGRAGGGGGGMVARRQRAAWAGARGRRAVLAVLGQLQRAVQPLGQVDAPQPTARRHLYTDAQVHLHTYLCVCVVYLSQMHRYTTGTPHTHTARQHRQTDRQVHHAHLASDLRNTSRQSYD